MMMENGLQSFCFSIYFARYYNTTQVILAD